MMRLWQRVGEPALWLLAALLALTWGLFVQPGTGKRLLQPAPEPARLECARWRALEQRREPDGMLIGVMYVCDEFGRVE